MANMLSQEVVVDWDNKVQHLGKCKQLMQRDQPTRILLHYPCKDIPWVSIRWRVASNMVMLLFY